VIEDQRTRVRLSLVAIRRIKVVEPMLEEGNEKMEGEQRGEYRSLFLQAGYTVLSTGDIIRSCFLCAMNC